MPPSPVTILKAWGLAIKQERIARIDKLSNPAFPPSPRPSSHTIVLATIRQQRQWRIVVNTSSAAGLPTAFRGRYTTVPQKRNRPSTDVDGKIEAFKQIQPSQQEVAGQQSLPNELQKTQLPPHLQQAISANQARTIQQLREEIRELKKDNTVQVKDDEINQLAGKLGELGKRNQRQALQIQQLEDTIKRQAGHIEQSDSRNQQLLRDRTNLQSSNEGLRSLFNQEVLGRLGETLASVIPRQSGR
ncbi:hypothetical protein PG994_011829 [Apiospora phragmitis]|uniref:Uncharacterized protein n=1 Tax=Apiospora phragmitis TaxID=2905665 RepID=A0ABR1TTW5_9PEZI